MLLHLILTLKVSILTAQIVPGAARLDKYLPKIKGKRVGIVMHHASLVGQRLLVDTLHALGVQIRKIFVPEHGFLGSLPPGAEVQDTSYEGIPVISVYGKNKTFPPQLLDGIDILLFDLQDVGVRVYTYISTLYYAMDACARQGIPLIVLDRPNPNIDVVDGPMLRDSSLRSFVGVVPVPLSYGLTIGELAQMMNGEGWLPSGKRCSLSVIPVANYSRDSVYMPPVAPSPNLRTLRAIRLYPVLVLFEGTAWSVGRGTEAPFELICSAEVEGPQCWQRHGKPCCGYSFQHIPMDSLLQRKRLPWHWHVQAYQAYPDKAHYFNSYFDKLAGDRRVREWIAAGAPAEALQRLWEEDNRRFQQRSRQYYLYH